MENVDYAFVSPLFAGQYEAFQALVDYRAKYEGRGTTLLGARMIFNITEKASLGLIGQNLLNLTYADRPGYLGQPINFTARFSYSFTGKYRVKKEKETVE